LYNKVSLKRLIRLIWHAEMPVGNRSDAPVEFIG